MTLKVFPTSKARLPKFQALQLAVHGTTTTTSGVFRFSSNGAPVSVQSREQCSSAACLCGVK